MKVCYSSPYSSPYSSQVRCEYILDEGPMILTGGIPGKEDMPVAYVGNAEKGAVNVKLVVNVRLDHMSNPPCSEHVYLVARGERKTRSYE